MKTAEIMLPALKELATVRSMKVNEIDILTDKKKMVRGDALDDILNNCLVTDLGEVRELMSSDRNALLIATRRATFGDDYIFQVESPYQEDSKKKQEFEIDLSELEAHHGDREYVDAWLKDKSKTFPYMMEDKKTRIYWSFTSGVDFKKTLKTIKSGADKASADLLARIKKIVTVDENGVETPIEQNLKNFVKDMDFADMDDFNEFYKEKCPYLDDKINLECQETGDDFEVKMEINIENFFKRNSRKKTSSSES